MDTRINAVRAAMWRFGVTGEESQTKLINATESALEELLTRIRGLADDKAFGQGIAKLASVLKGFVAANDEMLKIEELKAEIVRNRTLTIATQAIELIQMAVSAAQKDAGEAKASAANELAQADRLSLILAVFMMMSLIGSGVFSFLGIARPLIRLNGALGKMAAGELDVEIPGANRGDEVGDIAKTVVIIREKAEHKARDEAEASANQGKHEAQQRKADMIKLANSFESTVGEIVESVSSASTELEASAST